MDLLDAHRRRSLRAHCDDTMPNLSKSSAVSQSNKSAHTTNLDTERCGLAVNFGHNHPIVQRASFKAEAHLRAIGECHGVYIRICVDLHRGREDT